MEVFEYDHINFIGFNLGICFEVNDRNHRLGLQDLFPCSSVSYLIQSV